MGNLARKTSGWAKNRLPAPAISGLRAGIERFGEVTSTARLLPDFVVVGAQRSGTTSLYRMLSEHPAVVRPTASKGIGYFDVNYERGPRWYRGHFPFALTAALRSHPHKPRVFESSGYYSYHPFAAERLARDIPGVKLLMMVRDPVERAYSAHRHELMRGFETEEFVRALELEPARIEGELEKMAVQPGYDSYHLRHHSYLGRSRYAQQIKRIRRAVGGENLYVLDADAFFADPHSEFAALQRWLGLPLWQPAEVKAENARPRSPMDPALRQQLLDYFEPYDRELVTLMGKVPTWRQAQWGGPESP